MLLTKTALLLLTVALTTANQIEDALMSKTQLSETFYIFDVISDAPADEIKASMAKVKVLIRHSFQVIGERRYFFVVLNDQSEAVRQILFPVGSRVTQYPAEHARDYMKLFGVDGWNTSDLVLDNKNLFLIIWDYEVPGGTTASHYIETMTKFGESAKHAVSLLPFAPYFVIGQFPTKYFVFANERDYSTSRLTLDIMKIIGDPGRITHMHLRLFD